MPPPHFPGSITAWPRLAPSLDTPGPCPLPPMDQRWIPHTSEPIRCLQQLSTGSKERAAQPASKSRALGKEQVAWGRSSTGLLGPG